MSNTNIYLGRACPGKHLAHSTVTLAAASVLSTFDLLKKVDENGQEINPKMEYAAAAIRSVLFLVLTFVFLAFDMSSIVNHLTSLV
jgi:hypothetical protein